VTTLVVSYRAFVGGCRPTDDVSDGQDHFFSVRKAYTCFTAKGLCAVGCDPVWAEMLCDGTRPAVCSCSLVESRFGAGERAIGEIMRSIEGLSSTIDWLVDAQALQRRSRSNVGFETRALIDKG
jgi:hypothetical protein